MGLVAIAASRKQIELQEQQFQHSVDHLQDQAKSALAQGREDLAREALSRKAAAQAQIDAMESQHQQLAEQQEKLERTLDAPPQESSKTSAVTPMTSSRNSTKPERPPRWTRNWPRSRPKSAQAHQHRLR